MDKALYIIAYDVTSATIERRLVKLLTDYGVRYQYSIFIAEISKDQKEKLTKGLQILYTEAVKSKEKPEDLFRVSVIPLCATCAHDRTEIGGVFFWPTGSLVI